MSIQTRQTASGARYDVRLRDPSGRVYNRTFRTKREAETYRAREVADRSRGAWVDPRRAAMTFDELAAWWLDSNPGKRLGTRERDAGIIRLHLRPTLGSRPIAP